MKRPLHAPQRRMERCECAGRLFEVRTCDPAIACACLRGSNSTLYENPRDLVRGSDREHRWMLLPRGHGQGDPIDATGELAKQSPRRPLPRTSPTLHALDGFQHQREVEVQQYPPQGFARPQKRPGTRNIGDVGQQTLRVRQTRRSQARDKRAPAVHTATQLPSSITSLPDQTVRCGSRDGPQAQYVA
jgi:hypothetical protein